MTNNAELSRHPQQQKITSLKSGRPWMLNSINKYIKIFGQKYKEMLTLTLPSLGVVVNAVVVVAVVKVIIAKSSYESLRVLDLDNSPWAKYLFARMRFCEKSLYY